MEWLPSSTSTSPSKVIWGTKDLNLFGIGKAVEENCSDHLPLLKAMMAQASYPRVTDLTTAFQAWAMKLRAPYSDQAELYYKNQAYALRQCISHIRRSACNAKTGERLGPVMSELIAAFVGAGGGNGRKGKKGSLTSASLTPRRKALKRKLCKRRKVVQQTEPTHPEDEESEEEDPSSDAPMVHHK